MDDRKQSISPQNLYARLGSEAAPIVIDVRRNADFAAVDTLVADAFHCTGAGYSPVSAKPRPGRVASRFGPKATASRDSMASQSPH
jgi:hypothetical protein